MIVFYAGNIGEREELFKDLINHRLYSYHYLKDSNGSMKEFNVKVENNKSKQPIVNIDKVAPGKNKTAEYNVPYLEVF